MKKKIERLCRDILTDPIRIVIGEIGEVCISFSARWFDLFCTKPSLVYNDIISCKEYPKPLKPYRISTKCFLRDLLVSS